MTAPADAARLRAAVARYTGRLRAALASPGSPLH